MRYFDSFAGIGGFSLGIKQAYENLSITSRGKQGRTKKNSANDEFKQLATQQPTCIGYSEIDKYAVQVYNKQFNHKNYGDITKIQWDKVPNFDLLVGGSPCQDFSIAGQRSGIKGNRSGLVWEFIRALQEKKPKYFIWENVKGVMSSRNGFDFASILIAFSESGYSLQWEVLNSRYFGVPQKRERIFIVGYSGKGSGRQIFPIGEDDEESSKKYNTRKEKASEIAQTLVASYGKGGKGSHIKIDKEGTRSDDNFVIHNVYGGFGEKKVREFHKISPTIRTPQGGGHIPMIVSKKGKPKKNQKIASCLTGGGHSGGNHSDMDLIKAVLTPDRKNKRQNGRRMKKNGEPSFTVTAQDQHGVYDGHSIRRLTPVECERLQGFPPNWTEEGIIDVPFHTVGRGITQNYKVVKISDTQRYKMCGNAVTVNVVQAIVEKIIN